MNSVLRPYDSIGRYGGEEFLVVFPKCELANALAIAERIRRSISRATVSTQTEEILVTASIGIAEVRDYTDANAAIREADNALFHAKQKGRDRIESSTLERMQQKTDQ
jgi:diguanylate cyclase (GGDEF)-like protein